MAQLQRGPCDETTRWNHEFGDVLARDFAVIARFKSLGGTSQPDHPFWEYFVFGLRGLGTWGAGWFIHHRANVLAEMVDREERRGNADVQLDRSTS